MTPHVVSHEQLQRRLEVVMRRLCPAWLRTDLDDLVQAAHLKIFRRGGEVGELKSAFLYRVGHSVLVDEIRKVKRRREDFDDLETPRQLPSPSPGPEAFVAGHETGVAIREALSELKPDQRRCVALYLQGHTVPEIADLLGWDKKKADNHLYRGLSALRSLLKKGGVCP